ncbi:ACY-2 protein [Aphelenchoides avenae]|nr:ACY-2 protein [Aphelenchus avenae]
MSKMAEFWGAETPYSGMGRENHDSGSDGPEVRRRPNYGNTVQSMTLIENNLNNLSGSSLRTMFHCTTGTTDTSSCGLSECRIFLLLSIPVAVANYVLVQYNVPQKVQSLMTGQILLCLVMLILVCILESFCKVAKFLLIIVSYATSVFLTIGQHLLLSFLAVVQHRVPVFSILWLPACISHLCIVFALYRLPYPFRCFLASVDCCIFLLLLILFSTSNVTQSAPIVSCQLTIILVNVIALFLLILFIAWITEFERKVETSCNVSFKNEEKDVQTMQDINKLLIDNILPCSVAAKFLAPNRSNDELYARDHGCVCVMFASIPNFKDYWQECDKSRKLECLRLLNEIVCEFDKLLTKPKYSCIEKIKTVSSTYMAAAGLNDGDGDDKAHRNASVMVEYALAMSIVLDQLNIEAFQNFELRIGMSIGPLVAGVIGAQKPQYDIWGNTVNMASRMDSHGEIRKIHMTGEMARLLPSDHYHVQSRGKIRVKGVKDEMETFFVPLNVKRNVANGPPINNLHGAF